MYLRLVFLLITRLAAWLRLSRREETWKTAEILILRHQLAVLQRQQPRRPKLNWADRALLAALLGVIPKAHRKGLRLLVTPDTIVRWHPRHHPAPLGGAVHARQDRPPGHPPEHQGPDPVPLEYSIAWLTCAFASGQGAVMVGWPGATQDRLPASSPDTRPRCPGAP
jgi:hypothetical protein